MTRLRLFRMAYRVRRCQHATRTSAAWYALSASIARLPF